MTAANAIEIRCSRRKYDGTPIAASPISEINSLIRQCVEKEGLNIQLVLDNGAAFNSFTKSYGMFSGVTNYIGLIADKKVENCAEKLGYYGELIVLHATNLGLGTCWVGGTFDRSLCPFELSPDENIVCVIVIGNAPADLSVKEKLIHRIIHRKAKAAEQMFKADGQVPEWFMAGVRAVQKAPSAVNRQPVIFTYSPENDKVTAFVENINDDGYAIDLGIAKLHFRIGAGGGTWDFGNHGSFARDAE